MAWKTLATDSRTHIEVLLGGRILSGDLGMPVAPLGLVVFAHGSGSSRHSPRNRFVAGRLGQGRLATLLIDLLTPTEEAVDEDTAQFRFDIPMLASRLVTIIDFLRRHEETAHLPIGLFGASTGAGAALIAAAERPLDVFAVVSRGGRPDLAGQALSRVMAPTLLIVGGLDTAVVQMNREALKQMRDEASLEIVPGASHLFEEPGTLDRVAALATIWFTRHFLPIAERARGRS